MIDYQTTIDDVTPTDLDGFFVGWPSHPDPTTHHRILDNSYAVVLAKDSDTDRIVGFANAISDGALSAYIPLLEVRPDWQHHGIGTRLIELLCDQLDHLYMVDLVCDPGLEDFYAPLGFQTLTGMARRHYDHQSGAPRSDAG